MKERKKKTPGLFVGLSPEEIVFGKKSGPGLVNYELARNVPSSKRFLSKPPRSNNDSFFGCE